MASNFKIDLFNCGVCSEKYNQWGRKPKMLDCHHTFCQMCLEQIWNRQDKKRIVCPYCSEATKPGKKGVEGLKVNHYLNQFEDLLKAGTKSNDRRSSYDSELAYAVSHVSNVSDSSVQEEDEPLDNDDNSYPEYYILNQTLTCPKHGGEITLIFYCNTCELPVCKQCIDREHQGRNHDIADFDESKFAQDTNSCLERIKIILERMQKDLGLLLPLFRNRTQIIGNSVNTALAGIYSSLNFRVDELDTETDNEIRKAVECDMDNITELWALKYKLNQLEKRVKEGDKDLKENLAETTELVKDDVMVSFVKPNKSFKVKYCPNCAQTMSENAAIIGASNHAVKEYRCRGCLAIINHFKRQ